jgi:hypothetical protein
MTVDQAVTKALALIEARDYVSFAELDREIPCGRGFRAVAARPGSPGMRSDERDLHALVLVENEAIPVAAAR